MGSGHNYIRKIIKSETKYIEKCEDHHKHKFEVECILKVTNNNDKFKSNRYECISYYHVKKCKHCNSFVSIPEKFNVQGKIFEKNNIENSSLPLLETEIDQNSFINYFCTFNNVKLKK